ncbi:hypothetical protein BH09ACT13_BH09ACT13_15350 [soil metagenome]
MIAFALLVALGTLAVGLPGALLLRKLPTLRLQLTALALLSVLLPLGAVVASGVFMFNSGHDLTVLAVAAGSATAALVAALLVARSLATSVQRLAGTAERLSQGDLAARAAEVGAA